MIKRTVKDPEVRREELIDTAEELFIKKGYDETSVSEIVRKARVAQGTFYYYFKSKDDVRNAVIDKNISEVKSIIDKMMATKELSALERMTMFSFGFSEWAAGKGKMIDYIHEEGNEVIHHRMAHKVLDYLAPAYEKIIRQGIKEGVFKTKYPQEAALAIMGMTESIFEGKHTPDLSEPENLRKYMAILDLTEKMLDAEPGTFLKFLRSKGYKFK